MRVKLAISLSFTRDRDEPDEPRPPSVDEKGSAQVEQAGWRPVGFAIDPTNQQNGPEEAAE